MRAARAASTSRCGSSSTSTFAPTSTVSTHSVDGRKVEVPERRLREHVGPKLEPRVRQSGARSWVDREHERLLETVDAVDDAAEARLLRVRLAVERQHE